jgi:hypothetical protein
MIKITLKTMALTASMALTLGATPAFSAGDGPTGGTIGSNQVAKDSAGATDVWLLACPSGTKSARAGINEGNNDAVQLSVQVINPHGSAVTASGENGGVSPQAVLNGGPGAYIVTLHKDGMGIDGYTITLDCYDVNGVRSPGDQATLVQNQ